MFRRAHSAERKRIHQHLSIVISSPFPFPVVARVPFLSRLLTWLLYMEGQAEYFAHVGSKICNYKYRHQWTKNVCFPKLAFSRAQGILINLVIERTW